MTTHAFPLTGPINLSARIGHGALVVRAVDGLTEATVELEGPDDVIGRVAVERVGATLSVVAPRQGGLAEMLSALNPKSGGGPVTATVTVPPGTALHLTTVTASITVHGRSAGAAVSTAVGAVTLDDVDGDLAVRCGTSAVEVRSVTGAVSLRTGTGSVRLGRVDGAFEAGGGRVTVSVDRVGGAVRWRTGAGEARLGAVYGDVDVAAGSGAVSIGLPGGVTARLDVTTGAGSFVSDLPVNDHPANRDHVISVRARTGNGDVHVFRAA